MRNDFTGLAAKPLRSLRNSRIWSLPLISRLSPKRAAIAAARQFELQGRLDEALTSWKGLERTKQYQAARFRIMLRRARSAIQAKNWAGAVLDFETLLNLAPQDARAMRGLEVAALHGAREAQAEGLWLEACRMWVAFGQVSADRYKCVRNLNDSARYAAQSADSVEKMKDALEAWRLLKIVEPISREAQQGMEWCRLSLARSAERGEDLTGAREHWNALLELSPGDQRALAGLKRLDDAGAA